MSTDDGSEAAAEKESTIDMLMETIAETLTELVFSWEGDSEFS